MSNAWRHPPKKRSYYERKGRYWIWSITIIILVYVIIHFTGIAIEKAAYDAVNFDHFKG